MATSGSVDFSLTATQLLTEAYRMIGVVALGDSMSTNQGTQGMTVLNLMLKSWATNPRLWLKTEGSVVLTATTQSYTVATARRILSMRRRTSSLDTPMTELAREEYFDLSNKASEGMPVNWYFDPQRAARTLYIWPVASTAIAASTTLRYTYQRVIEDIDALSNDFDLPQEWLEAITYNVAVRLARYVNQPSGSDAATFADIKEEAARLLAALEADDDETVSVFFQPA